MQGVAYLQKTPKDGPQYTAAPAVLPKAMG